MGRKGQKREKDRRDFSTVSFKKKQDTKKDVLSWGMWGGEKISKKRGTRRRTALWIISSRRSGDWEVSSIQIEPSSPREGREPGKGTNHEMKEIIDDV